MQALLTERDKSSDPAPGNNEFKTRGRIRHRQVKRGTRPQPLSFLNDTRQPIGVKHHINRLRGRRKITGKNKYGPIWN